MKNFSKVISGLFKQSRPWSLILGILMYFLGGGVLGYLGRTINWAVFFLGLGCIILLQSSSYLLKQYYDRPTPLNRPLGTKSPDENDPLIDRRIFLEVAITFLAIGAVLTVLLTIQNAIHLPSLFILGAAFIISFTYAIPPFRLVYSGYGELADAILITNLSPMLAIVLQSSDLHRLLPMLTFPITSLYLAGSISESLLNYASDTKYFRKTLLVRLGWQLGMNLHNILILVSYLLLAIALLTGLPLILGAPGFLTLPIGIYQIIKIRQIAGGAKPHWTLLSLLARIIPIITAYLFAFALWTR
jgi:1,4-dihydroxy-2-naphthoate octaprenyltransferase